VKPLRLLGRLPFALALSVLVHALLLGVGATAMAPTDALRLEAAAPTLRAVLSPMSATPPPAAPSADTGALQALPPPPAPSPEWAQGDDQDARYYDAFRRRIEDRGRRHFPEWAGQKLYGELTMAITVNHDGAVLNTRVLESSGVLALDQRAQALVHALRFGRFDPEMRRLADQRVFVSRFHFAQDEGGHSRGRSAP
jgi:TonB family protein